MGYFISGVYAMMAFSLIPEVFNFPVGRAAWLTFWIMLYILYRKMRHGKGT